MTSAKKNKFRHFVFAVMALMAVVMLASCRKNDGKKTIAVSIEPQRAILEQIVGDRFTVTTILPSGANPETFEPTMKTRKDVDDAVAYFTVGAMPFEQRLASTLPGDVLSVDVSKGITPVYGTHDHEGHEGHEGHSHGSADPHTWTSVKNARVMAKNMYDAVLKLDPKGSDYYSERYNRLVSHLDSLDREFTRRLAPSAGKAFAVWHPSLSYFARDYGLEQISVGFENKELSPKRMAEVAEHARQEGVTVLFFQKEYDSRQARSFADELGTKLITINPLDYDWESQLKTVVRALE